MMGRIRLTRLILISFFSLLVIQILIVGIFGKFSALEFRQREKESVDYILSMYSRNMEGALEKTDNDLEDILLSNRYEDEKERIQERNIFSFSDCSAWYSVFIY
jgi:hypothetical protein